MTVHLGRPQMPGASRGIAPLVIAGGLGLARAAYGAIDANQQRQRNKGYISAAYRSAASRLDTREGDIRQSTAEAMNARGLGGSASAVRAAMMNGKPVSASQPTDLAGQSATELGKEFALEHTDLESSYHQALNENNAGALNAQIGSIASGVGAAENVYGAVQDLGALKSAAPPSAARQAYMSGIDDPANTWGGIHPIDPLNAPGSSWNRKTTTVGAGQANYDFNTGNG